MARTKQTARKSTDESFWTPRAQYRRRASAATRREAEKVVWIPIRLDPELPWPQWSREYPNALLGPLSDFEGCRKVVLGRKVQDPRQAVFVVFLETREDFEEFQGPAFREPLLVDLGRDPAQPDDIVILSMEYGIGFDLIRDLVGRVTLTKFAMPESGEYIRRRLDAPYKAFRGFAPDGCDSLRVPPYLQRHAFAWHDFGASSHPYDRSERLQCWNFFRWSGPVDCRELESWAAENSEAKASWSKILSSMAIGPDKWGQERWEFATSPSHTSLSQPVGAQMVQEGKGEAEDVGEAEREEEEEEEEEEDDDAPSEKLEGFQKLLDRRNETPMRLSCLAIETLSATQLEAMHKVLDLPDTLACILRYLPQRDLLLDQRVCRLWNHTISTSGTLQQALFFRPRQSPISPGEFNPLLSRHFPGFFTSKFANFGLVGPWSESRWHNRNTVWPPAQSPYKRPEASWRRMLLCNPAPTEYQFLHYRTSWGHNYDWLFKSVTSPTFLTFGVLHDILERAWFHGKGMPASNSVELNYGPLSFAADYGAKEAKTAWIHEEAMKERRNEFPSEEFDVPGKVIVELSYRMGCMQAPTPPRWYGLVVGDFDCGANGETVKFDKVIRKSGREEEEGNAEEVDDEEESDSDESEAE